MTSQGQVEYQISAKLVRNRKLRECLFTANWSASSARTSAAGPQKAAWRAQAVAETRRTKQRTEETLGNVVCAMAKVNHPPPVPATELQRTQECEP